MLGHERVPGVPPVGVVRLTGHGPGGPPARGAHTHDFLVVLYAHRADGDLVLDGRMWSVTDGDVFMIAPGQVVSPVGTDSGTVDGWAVSFAADVLRRAPAGALSSWRAHPLLFPFARDAAARTQRLRVPSADRPAWAARCSALAAETRERRAGYEDAVAAHLTLLLVEVSRLSADLGGDLRAVDEPVLAAVFDLVEARYQEPISLADVAAELGLTPGHLTTVVRRKTGRTVQQWITERRMQAARRLLAETDLPIATVSGRVGYRDVGYFTRRFRAEHGMTPRRWRLGGR